MMLSNVLPGLRDLRAPLAAGFIWLLALFLIYEEEFESPTGVLGSLDDLRHELGPVAQGAALTFTAYLVGSLADAVGALPFRLGQQREGSELPFRRAESPARSGFRRALLPFEQLARTIALAVRNVLRPSIRGRRVPPLALDHEASQTLSGLIEEALTTRPFVDDPDRLPRMLMDEDEFLRWREWVEETKATDAQCHEALVSYVRDTISRESDDMRVRLMIDQPALFERVDRLQAEGEFRRAVALPLLVLAWLAREDLGLFLFVVVTGATALLFLQGMQRRYQADAALVEALRVSRPISPTLERIKAEAKPPKPAIAAPTPG